MPTYTPPVVQDTEFRNQTVEAIWNLRSSDDQRALDEALRDALERLTRRANVRTIFQHEGEVVPIIPRVQHEIIMSLVKRF